MWAGADLVWYNKIRETKRRSKMITHECMGGSVLFNGGIFSMVAVYEEVVKPASECPEKKPVSIS